MSVQDALTFIQKIGARPDLQEKLRILGDRPELGDVVAMGAGEGFEFSEQEFRAAFTKDWKMRRYYFSGEK